MKNPLTPPHIGWLIVALCFGLTLWCGIWIGLKLGEASAVIQGVENVQREAAELLLKIDSVHTRLERLCEGGVRTACRIR